MKKFKNIYVFLFSLMAAFYGCQENDYEIGEIVSPSNISITAEIVGQDSNNPDGDGSGSVNFTATADNASSYVYYFDGVAEASPSGLLSNRFSKVGVNTYTVVVKANGTGGISSTKSMDVTVYSSFTDVEAENFLSGGPGSSKIWYPKLDQKGHLGVGPTLEQDLADDNNLNGHWYPQYDSTDAFGKCGGQDTDCFCDYSLTFSLSTDNNLTFIQNNNGKTFFNWAHGSVVGQQFNQFSDTCFEFDASNVSEVSLVPSSTDWSQVADPDFLEPRGTEMNFTNNGFMGYYTGVSSYEILEIEEDYLYVRFYDSVNPVLSWYQMFTTTPPNQGPNYTYNNLVWEDDFNTDGAPNAANWTYDLGAGGWGNGELQNYTNNAENAKVEGGSLIITAKADGNGGYTSARLKSQGLYEFTYGRVEVKAKLPASAGTWPAIWMLGANFPTVGWPQTGEIDIMEQTGADKNTTLGTCHWFDTASASNASYGETTAVANASSEFHLYTMEWTDTAIKIYLDDAPFYELANDGSLPFNADFFLILNIAMGGTLGGTIDSSFTEDTMEIDYVKVFQ